MKSIKAWWFCPPDGKLSHGDGRIPKKGITHAVDISKQALILYEYGLHASIDLYDAYFYAESTVVYRVKLKGNMLKGEDIICAEKRKYLSDDIDISDSIEKWELNNDSYLETTVLEDHPELNV